MTLLGFTLLAKISCVTVITFFRQEMMRSPSKILEKLVKVGVEQHKQQAQFKILN